MEVVEDHVYLGPDYPTPINLLGFTNFVVPWADTSPDMVDRDKGRVEGGPFIEVFLISNNSVVRREFATVQALLGPSSAGGPPLMASEVDPLNVEDPINPEGVQSIGKSVRNCCNLPASAEIY